MGEERKKAGTGLWATAGLVAATVVLVLLLYVGSFGVWLRYNSTATGDIKSDSYIWPYYPMFWLMDSGPAPVKSALRSYVVWWLR